MYNVYVYNVYYYPKNAFLRKLCRVIDRVNEINKNYS